VYFDISHKMKHFSVTEFITETEMAFYQHPRSGALAIKAKFSKEIIFIFVGTDLQRFMYTCIYGADVTFEIQL
jgi:hypothetical protein